MRWTRWITLAPMAFLPLAGCDTPPPGVDAAAWQQALVTCKERAAAAGYRSWSGFNQIGHPGRFVQDASWEVVDPCMEAKGFPPPP
jgi:hypothetical protein